MKRLLLLAVLFAASVLAQDSPFLKDEALTAEVAANCAQGCIVFSPEKAAAFVAEVNAELDRRTQAAFEEGKRLGNLSCRNAI